MTTETRLLACDRCQRTRNGMGKQVDLIEARPPVYAQNSTDDRFALKLCPGCYVGLGMQVRKWLDSGKPTTNQIGD